MYIKIFEGSTLQEAANKALVEGFSIATWDQVYQLQEEGKIQSGAGYDTSTIYLNGKVRDATIEEMKNLKEVYRQKGRVLFVNYFNGRLYGINYLDNKGRFVGIKND